MRPRRFVSVATLARLATSALICLGGGASGVAGLGAPQSANPRHHTKGSTPTAWKAASGEPWTEEAKLTAFDGSALDWFGTAVALSGERALVGAWGDDDDRGEDSGSAHVFERQADGTWHEVAKLTGSDGAENDHFGTSVALSGELALVGAVLDDDLGSMSGSAYVFERQPSGAWTEAAKLTASDGAAADFFGRSVALFGERALIGADEDVKFPPGPGAAYVFERQDDGIWVEAAKLTASDGVYDRFGRSVALAADRALIGADLDDGLEYSTGSAYIFERQPDGTWIEAAKLTASDWERFDYFGNSVALSGERALIGKVRGAGSAYIFERQVDGSWSEVAKLVASDGLPGDAFTEVALAGQRALVGAPGDDDLGDVSGSAYVFERRPDGTWSEVAKLTASDEVAGDNLGSAVALTEERALLGAWGDDDRGLNSGSAYVYSLEACELDLALDPMTLRAGEELRVAVDLVHRRPVKVTVPLVLWVEDAAGRVVVQESSAPITMEDGDRLRRRLAVTLPLGMAPGGYRVLVGVSRMEQGIAWASQEFDVIE